mgnify:CR=1 FL=1
MSGKQRAQFFKVVPKQGLPLSIPGVAEGLAGMARALERMTVQGGQVRWWDGVPTIVVPGELPACPVADGTYYLRAVVSGGVCSMTWVEAVVADCDA